MARRFRVVAGLVAVAMLGAACSGSGSSGNDQGNQGGKVTEGGTLRIGTSSTIDTLNPFTAFQANAILVFLYEYPYLAQYDNKNEIVPEFATSWDTSSDGLTLTFHLTPNAQWSDGQPLTAEDVAWTYNTVIKFQDGPTSYYAGDVVDMKTVTAVDPTTVAFHYDRPVASAVSHIITIPVLPEHVWGKLATGDGKALRTYQNQPTDGQPVVSGGPFVLVQYQKDQIALMQRNDKFWGTKPHIDGFGIQIYSNDDAMVQALKSGELDAVETVPTTSVKTVQESGFTVSKSPGVFFYDFILNSNPKKPEHRELLNPQVREAFEYAINRQQIIDVALGGYGTLGDSIIPPAIGSWHDPNIKPLPFDISKANEILDSLGYAKGSDGIRVAEGHPMAYTVIIPNSREADLTRTFQIMQPDFKQIGVKLSLKVLDPSAAFDAIGAPDYKYLDFDLAMWDWIPGVDPSSILSVLLCNQYGSNSDTGYCDKTYDDMYTQQEQAIDPSKRKQIVNQMQEKLFNDRPYIILNYPDVIDAYDGKKWAGFYNEPGYGVINNNGIQSLVQVHQT
jgi:peptide/nickel transport system substrate-binding protein